MSYNNIYYKMVYLEYNILGKNKQIKIDEMDHHENKNVIMHDEKHYEYKIGKKEQDTFKKLLKILKLWNEFTEQNRIDYWACGGTLLGAVRHSGFIPWDNDIDVCIMLSDLKKIKKKLDNHPVLRYYECEHGLQLYIKNKDEDQDNNNDYSFPFLDVFICDYYNKNTIKYCGFLSRDGSPTWFTSDLFPNEQVYANELYPLKRVAFEDTTIMVPNNQVNVLYRMFSDKCLTICKIANHTFVHEFINKKIMEKRHKVLKTLYSVENTLNVPRKNTITSLHYKIIKKIETELNNNSNNNNLFNKVLFKSMKIISNA